jgi:cobalt-zinc-cadmium efflux system outer membrane protein
MRNKGEPFSTGKYLFGMVSLLVLFFGLVCVAQTQEPTNSPGQDQSHHHETSGQTSMQMEGMQHEMKPLPPARRPQLGLVQIQSGTRVVGLQELEQLALKNNPTLGQAKAEVGAAKGRGEQSGLWPNPVVGYTGEEIRGGSFRGGQQGFFVEQDILLGGKLAGNRRVLQQEVRQAELELDEQNLRVKTSVRRTFFQALAAQELLAVRRELARIAQESAKFDRQLNNVGQKDEAEVLQTEIAAQEAELAVISADHMHRRAMVALAAVVGDSTIQTTALTGRLDEGLPDLDSKQSVDALLRESPAVRIAETGVLRANAALARARAERVPDLRLRGGLEQNRELQETGRPVGLQGFAEVGVQLKLFDRNQGNVRAAAADLERAQLEVKRIELVLQERAAAYVDNYGTAKAMAARYQAEVLPRAQKAYELIYKRYGLMQASYPQVLTAERSLYRAQADYVAALGQVWSNAVTLQGFLLSDGLEAPTRPLDVDRAMREFNLPIGSGIQER